MRRWIHAMKSHTQKKKIIITTTVSPSSLENLKARSHTGLDNENNNENIKNARSWLVELAWVCSAWSNSTNRMRSLCVVIVIALVIAA